MRAFLALLLATIPLPAAAQIISGNATALDGDTIDMTGQRIRLFAIDAPELGQKCARGETNWDCGAEAKRHLGLLLQGGEVKCRVRGQNAQGFAIGECMISERDLSEAMVAAGFAVAIENSPGDVPYLELEQGVKTTKAGIWGGTFDSPSDWRKAHPQARIAASVRPKAQGAPRSAWPSGAQVYRNAFGCAIKGNVSQRNGEYIYYLPGMNYYDGTRPERLFCTEAEAQAAGFRRSRGG